MFALVFLIGMKFVAATGDSYWLCVDQGDTVAFSDCNENAPDYTCSSSTGCQYCVTDGDSPGVYCPGNYNACNQIQNQECTQLGQDGIDPNENGQAPVITLYNPDDGYTIATPGIIHFQYKVTMAITIDECTLYFDGQEVASNPSTVTSTANTISTIVPSGTHHWRIACTTRQQNQVAPLPSEERTLTVYGSGSNPGNQTNQTNNNSTNQTNPQTYNINLISPAQDEAFSNGAQDIAFEFGFSNSIIVGTLNSCNFVLDGNSEVFNVTNLSQSSNTITRNVGIGSHNWEVNCKKGAINYTSDNWAFSVNAPAPVNNGGNTGGGGGGGSSRRTVPLNTTNSTNKTIVPLVVKDKNANNDIEELNQPTVDETNDESKGSTSGITGSVIGRVLEENRAYAIVIAMILVVGIYIFVMMRKK